MEKSLTFEIFIKLILQKNLKLGVMITQVISIVQKIFVATATCLEGVDLLIPAVERVCNIILSTIIAGNNDSVLHVRIKILSTMKPWVLCYMESELG